MLFRSVGDAMAGLARVSYIVREGKAVPNPAMGDHKEAGVRGTEDDP